MSEQHGSDRGSRAEQKIMRGRGSKTNPGGVRDIIIFPNLPKKKFLVPKSGLHFGVDSCMAEFKVHVKVQRPKSKCL